MSAAGLVPLVKSAQDAGLTVLADRHLSVPGDKGANAGLAVTSLVAGMIAGADNIDDMALLRQGGDGQGIRPALRSFDVGLVPARVHLRPCPPAGRGRRPGAGRPGRLPPLVAGHAKEGARFGCSKVRGLNALLATVSTAQAAPVIVAGRLRKGSTGSPRGAKWLVADALATVARLRPAQAAGPVLLRADDAWTTIEYIDAIRDEARDVGLPRRGRRDRLHPRSPPNPRPPRSPDGWWCVVSPT